MLNSGAVVDAALRAFPKSLASQPIDREALTSVEIGVLWNV